MPKQGPRILIRMVSTTGTGTSFVTSKNRLNTPERLTLRKYDPKVRQHVLFKEQKL
ncbi:50S ribosomal protein L33 [Meiothermus granaticius]|uniref:Large ribosomal subunit protein bL33 n=1 Tax=Meiothermus granaticius NBRC 107808 TaxID=1227551 RepID=A0A399FDK5_9DEIN|nr:50S ribosomal protein L33 [Meiothermus granaticius]RIH93102.1 50S ribosomal protein L33 [Meiothermus granaticius NBRC 107808]GEM87994.1 50S ribosomal protein L33 [Meiothermus granaticius NBRC 107808]